MLFNEPKLLKYPLQHRPSVAFLSFSALQRAEIAEISLRRRRHLGNSGAVSVLFNEPKLLKSERLTIKRVGRAGFSALQRAEIAEIGRGVARRGADRRFSALQRAEIAEMCARWGRSSSTR